MAKEVAIGKRAKISEAQQYMIIAVIGASIVLGVAISLTVYFIQHIVFNASVIAAEEQSMTNYSTVIKNAGICKKPSGSIYTERELSSCDPNTVDTSEIQGSLRYNILENLAANEYLDSVQKQDISSCIDPLLNERFTYKTLSKKYKDAKTPLEKAEASQLLKSCSALRIIPDALPSSRNEEALLSSLNKLFIISGFEPESLSPSGSDGSGSSGTTGLHPIAINLTMQHSNVATVMTVVNNIEKSIRQFDFMRATFEWEKEGTLNFNGQAMAYYMDTSSISESEQTMSMEDK